MPKSVITLKMDNANKRVLQMLNRQKDLYTQSLGVIYIKTEH